MIREGAVAPLAVLEGHQTAPILLEAIATGQEVGKPLGTIHDGYEADQVCVHDDHLLSDK